MKCCVCCLAFSAATDEHVRFQRAQTRRRRCSPFFPKFLSELAYEHYRTAAHASRGCVDRRIRPTTPTQSKSGRYAPKPKRCSMHLKSGIGRCIPGEIARCATGRSRARYKRGEAYLADFPGRRVRQPRPKRFSCAGGSAIHFLRGRISPTI